MESSGEYLHAKVSDYSMNPDPSKQNEVNHLSKQRLDSGVGDMDIGMRPVSTHHRNTTYDYIDNHYEDVPSPIRVNRSVSEQSTRKSALSGMSCNSEVLDFDDASTAGIIKLPDKRKKYNPLYETSVRTSQKLSGENSAHVQNLHKRITCHSVVLIVVLTFSFGALGLGLYLKMESEFRYAEMAKTLELLQEKYENVSAQLSNTTSNLPVLKEELSNTQQQIALAQDDLMKTLNQFNSNISQHLQNLSASIQSKDLSNFTQLSSCYYKKYPMSMARGRESYPTRYHPVVGEHEFADVPMFAYCTVQGGDMSELQINYTVSREPAYRCLCGGLTNEAERICTLHLWLCPRGS